MNRHYKPHRKARNYTVPVGILGFVAAALILWFIWAKGNDVLRYFKGKVVYVPDNTAANRNLEKLMDELNGDKSQLLALAANSEVRLGWIKNDKTKRHVRWILMNNLLDNGLWDEAIKILPEVEDLAPLPTLDRLAQAALLREDYELQLHLDDKLQDAAVDKAEETALLLRSIRRTAETDIRMQNVDGAVKAISRLDAPAVLARFSNPKLAAAAADLQMMRADVSTVKEHPLQLVRNILEQAKWPACRATSRLMLEEVSAALVDSPILPQATLRNIEAKLIHCRDVLQEYSDREHKLPQCYLLLGELRLRLGDYTGCVQALTLAQAFADGYGLSNTDNELKVARLRAKANSARGAKAEALADCRFLAEHETSPEELMTALTYLSAHTEGTEREKILARLWDVMKAQPQNTPKDLRERARIATEISNIHAEAGAKDQAVKWGIEAMRTMQEAYPDITDGKALRAGLNLALLQRKKNDDTQALRRLRDLVKVIEDLAPAQREALDNADKTLYITAVREYARTCLFTGDRDVARRLVRKIHEDLPEKRR